MSKYFLLAILFAITFSCTKENEEPVSLPVTLAGEVFTTDEFGYTTSGREDIKVSVGGASTVESATDEHGKYLIEKLKTGTYNITFSKEGFGTSVIQGLPLLGGNVPVYLNANLIRSSTTQLSNLSVTINNNQFVLTGKVIHTYPYDTDVNGPRAIFFLGKEGNVSGHAYQQSFSNVLNYSSGETFNLTSAIDYKVFPSGTTVYIIGYGVASYDAGYLDLASDLIIYPTLNGQPSNITSIKIP